MAGISNRRNFIRILGSLTILPLFYLWGRGTARHMSHHRQVSRYELAGPLPEGLSVRGPVVVNRRGNEVLIYSSRCSHLGCRVKVGGNDQLVCPCHGSVYGPDGMNREGPSGKPLKQLPFQHLPGQDRWIVEL